jgi:hypothetical protein
MEDEGFVDDSFIEETAWEYVALHGYGCMSVLARFAEVAARAGDEISAQTWHAIAEAADRILTTGYGSSGVFRPPG